MLKQSKHRKVGQIRQVAATAPTQPHIIPHSIRDLSVDGINLYTESKSLESNRDEVFNKYEEIIEDLERVIHNLEQKNMFLAEDRLRLIQQNMKLQEQVDHLQHNYLGLDSRIKQTAIFDVVTDEKSIVGVAHKANRKSSEILQQSQFDLGTVNHYLAEQLDAELSISDAEAKSMERTPCLNSHHRLIQCSANNNQAPLRIFYLLLLQEQEYINKLKQLLLQCTQDDCRILLPLLPGGNKLWANILEEFLNSIVQGKFDDETQVIEYLSENPLMDILLVSLLKQFLPVENEDSSLNVGDWKHQVIDHRVLFQGLCNQFDLRFQAASNQFVFRFYANSMAGHGKSQAKWDEEESEQNLLQSRAVKDKKSQLPVQISLCAKNQPLISHSQSRQQAKFEVFMDPQAKHYRVNISIRPERYEHNDEGMETSSFHQTEPQGDKQQQQQQQQEELSILESEDYSESHIKQDRRPLAPKDLNKQFRAFGCNKYSHNDDYLKPESRKASGNNSNNHSMFYE